jgi:hypothetical protein
MKGKRYVIIERETRPVILGPEDEETIKQAVHDYARLWRTKMAKRTTVERALGRKKYRYGYDVKDAKTKVLIMIAAGKLELCEDGKYIRDPYPEKAVEELPNE